MTHPLKKGMAATIFLASCGLSYQHLTDLHESHEARYADGRACDAHMREQEKACLEDIAANRACQSRPCADYAFEQRREMLDWEGEHRLSMQVSAMATAGTGLLGLGFGAAAVAGALRRGRKTPPAPGR